MTDQPTFEDELIRRALIEDAAFAATDEDGIERIDGLMTLDGEGMVSLAATVHEDHTHPIAATAIVRKDAVTEIAPPDVEALLAASHTPEETP